jgi:branched-chain amino acid transport system substrate-binding protein
MAKSGFMAEYDEPDVYGAQIEINAINKSGGLLGHQLEPVWIDSKSDQKTNAQATTQLLAHNPAPSAIVESCDLNFGGPGGVISSKAGKITLGCAGDPRWGPQGIGVNAFTLNTVTPDEGCTAADWAYYHQHWRSAYILNDTFIQYTDALGNYFKDCWSKLPGVSIVGQDTYNNASTTFSTQVSSIRSLSKQPDFIYMTACTPGGPTLLRELRAAGVQTVVVSDNCILGNFWLASVPGLKNFYFTAYDTPYGDDPSSAVNNFYTTFNGLYPSVVNKQFGSVGYSQVQAYAAAVKAAGTFDPNAVRTQMEKFTGQPILIGPTTWTTTLHADNSRPFLILKVENGKDKALYYYKARFIVPPSF